MTRLLILSKAIFIDAALRISWFKLQACVV